MRLQWKGRSYRPATNFVKVYKPDVNELMKPLSMKAGLGSAILTGQYISGDGNEPDVPVVSPSPSETPQPTPSFTPTETPTGTPAVTPTNTLTPSVTPSSTPFPFVQPSLWFDASDSTTMNLILSGGTTYISQLTSKGTSNWTLTGQTSDRYPTYSASTSLPGSPNIIRFTPNATAALRKGLVAFDRPTLTHTGSTIFMVWAQPAGTLAFINQLYSGNTNGTLVQSGTDILDRLQFGGIATNVSNTNVYPQSSSQSVVIPPPISAASLNSKYLMKAVLPANPGYGSWELNQSGGTGTLLFTGTTISPRWNALNLGCTTNTTQQLYSINNNIELAEIMIYNYELSSAEQEAVELYLRDKWRYDEWASPVPTPTATPQVTTTPTPSVSPTVTTSPTPSSTPPAFSPSGVTNLQYWFMADSGATVSSWTNYGGQGGSATQTAAANQPVIKTNSTLGSFTGTSVQFLNSADFMTGTTSSLNIQNHTSYIVYKPVTSSSSNFSIGLLSATTYNWFYQNWESAGTGSTRMNRGQYRTPAVDGAPHLIVSSGSTTGVIASRNDVLGVSATTATTGVLTDRYNLAGGGGANTADYQLFEWIFYSRQLTSTEHANVINYLKTKYQYNTW